MTYLNTRERWLKLRDRCLTESDIGFDTEYGDNQIAVWSLAIQSSKRINAMGYYPARGFVLPREALDDFALVLESTSIVKWAHNAVADTKSVSWHGIIAQNVMDTLSWLRVARPGMDSYGLKPAAMSFLGKPKRPGFVEVMSYTEVEETIKQEKTKVCSCGVEGCRKRKGHNRPVVDVVHRKEIPKTYNIHDIKPGHERWEMFEAYAAEDAVDAFELSTWLKNCRNLLVVDPLDGPVLRKEVAEFLRYRGTDARA